MQRFRIVHEFAGRPEDYWALYFDAGYTRAFAATASMDVVVEHEERTEARVVRRARFTSRLPVPAILRPFVKDALGYVEHVAFEPAPGRLEQRIVPTSMADRTEIQGRLSTEALAAIEGAAPRFRRVYEGTVSIRIPVVGGRIEANTVAEMQKGQDAVAELTRDWLARASRAA